MNEDQTEEIRRGSSLSNIHDSEYEHEHRKQKQELKKRALPTNVWIEILFFLLNVISTLIAAWYISIGITGFGWTTSINSIMDRDLHGPKIIQNTDKDKKYSMLGVPPHVFNLELMCIFIIIDACLIIAGCIASSYGGYNGQKYLLIAGFVAQVIAFLLELIVAEHVANQVDEKCDATRFKQRLTDLIKWYGIFHPNASDDKGSNLHENYTDGLNGYAKFGAMQFAIGCCGIDSWTDYEKYAHEFPPEALSELGANLKRNITGLPNSCCKPYWNQNIYCSENLINSKDREIIKGRLIEEGCVKKLTVMCEHMIYYFIVGIRNGLIVRAIIAVIACLLVFLQIRAIQLLSRGGNLGEGGQPEDDENEEDMEDHDHEGENEYGILSHQIPLIRNLTVNTTHIMEVLREKEAEDAAFDTPLDMKATIKDRRSQRKSDLLNKIPQKKTSFVHVPDDEFLSRVQSLEVILAKRAEAELALSEPNSFITDTSGQRKLTIEEIVIDEEDKRKLQKRARGRHSMDKKSKLIIPGPKKPVPIVSRNPRHRKRSLVPKHLKQKELGEPTLPKKEKKKSTRWHRWTDFW